MENSRIAQVTAFLQSEEWREKKAAVDQAAAPLSLRAKMLMSAYLPECRADGMADVRDLKSRGDFPRVGSTPTPGTTSLEKKRRWQKASAADLMFFAVLFAPD
jgi:hypothetical protein